MIICISGYTGSGKTFIAERLAKMLKIKHIARGYKVYASNHKEFFAVLKNADKKFAQKHDRLVIEEANKQDSVVSTWLGPWLIKNSTLNVWLEASLKERAKRLSNELKMPLQKTTKYIREKDRLTKKHFYEVYKIDMDKKDIFDLQINTEKLKIDQIVSIIAFLSLEKEGKRFE